MTASEQPECLRRGTSETLADPAEFGPTPDIGTWDSIPALVSLR